MFHHVNNCAQNQNHATRVYDGQALRERHPDRSDPFPPGVVEDEISIAFGRRHVAKLVDVVSLPGSKLNGKERAKALQGQTGAWRREEAAARREASRQTLPERLQGELAGVDRAPETRPRREAPLWADRLRPRESSAE